MLSVEQIARVAHEANRAYCIALNDLSQPSWDDAPEWQKQSAVIGVNYILEHEPCTVEPGDSHESWLGVKLKDGWTYGETKDPEKKTHPCCLPYFMLSVEQQTKDALFISVVESLRDLAEYE